MEKDSRETRTRDEKSRESRRLRGFGIRSGGSMRAGIRRQRGQEQRQ
ncbi:hypothetical protein HMPREF1986_00633 [Oribacterium sp. oral taxon 078 str. F0263]|nr:hypothetical protein HMPREF1986_00633 [Oribacterium sp. oral taxon 078 str. F0263]